MDPADQPVHVGDLVAVLGGSIGEDTARRIVLDACGELEIDTRGFSRQQALDVLERLAQSPGTTGVAARFGRSRLMLKWARDDLRALGR